jgi:hypothetical protein
MPTLLTDRCPEQRYEWPDKYGERFAPTYVWREQPRHHAKERYAYARKIVDLFVRHRQRKSTRHETASRTGTVLDLHLQAEPLRSEFAALADQWRRETQHFSLISRKVSHPAYLRIMGMGRPAIPLLLEELRDRPSHWFVALRFTANTDPVPQGANPGQARDAWLEWGRAEGLLD